MPNPSRRDFLKLATTGLLSAAGLMGLGGLFRFLDYESDAPAKKVIDVGSADLYPIGTRTVLSDIPAVLVSSETGFTALSLVCTHLGCTVESTGDGFRCPCHGSRYSEQGRVERGPARQNLQQLRVEVTPDNHVLVHVD